MLINIPWYSHFKGWLHCVVQEVEISCIPVLWVLWVGLIIKLTQDWWTGEKTNLIHIHKGLIEMRACSVMSHSLQPHELYTPPGFSVYGIFQARILECVAISYSRGSAWPKDGTHVSCVSCLGRQILYHWATMDRGARWDIVHKVAKSQTQLKRLGMHAQATWEAPHKNAPHKVMKSSCLYITFRQRKNHLWRVNQEACAWCTRLMEKQHSLFIRRS